MNKGEYDAILNYSSAFTIKTYRVIAWPEIEEGLKFQSKMNGGSFFYRIRQLSEGISVEILKS